MGILKENRGVVAIWIVLLITIPSLVFNVLSCSDHKDKSACVVDTAKVSALCDTLTAINLLNGTIASCVQDNADSLERLYGESIHTGTLKMMSDDMVENAVIIDSLIDEIHLSLKHTTK